MKSCPSAVQNYHLSHKLSTQSGFTLIELMMVIAIIGILATIATASYQNYIRQTQVMLIYQEINHFRMPYQILIDEGAGVTEFSPNGLNMPAQTKYCQFSVTPPNANAATPNTVQCQIQNLSYLLNETMSLARAADGSWQCRASAGIKVSYLPQACR